MNFNSYIFILLFLPFTLAGYYLLNRIKNDLGLLYLLAMSLWFYGYFNPYYLIIIIASIIVNFFISRGFVYLRAGKSQLLKPLLIVGVTINLAIIFWFKYYDFFVENINAIFGTDFICRNLLLPLGISFFTFQQISFVVDSYKGETDKYSFLEYAVFVTFFPQLVAGPIVLHNELIPQLKDSSLKHINSDNMVFGIMKFTYGLSKKILIADVLGRAVGFALADYSVSTAADLFIGILCYTFQIYFDFSGYSDMACGLAQMFNLSLPINFDSPYKANDIAGFWARWHMTLTRFLRTYVYFPLGGSRKGKIRKYLNLIIVFLISGLWHGANWTFIIWGFMHGCARVLYEIFKKPYEKLHKVIRWIINFGFINITWLMFRVNYWGDFFSIIKKILRGANLHLSEGMLACFMSDTCRTLTESLGMNHLQGIVPVFMVIAYLIISLILCLACENNYKREFKKNTFSFVVTAILLFSCIMSLGNVSTFLYFNF